MIIDGKIVVRQLPTGRWAWECPRGHCDRHTDTHGVYDNWAGAYHYGALVHALFFHPAVHVPHDLEAAA